MPHVRVGDVELYHELVDCTEPWKAGSPPVVLLHSLGTDRRIWLYQVPALCSRVPVLSVDLRGHGRSSAPEHDWSIGDMALDVVRLLRHLGCEKAHLVGVSMGGMVAQQFAIDYPYATASLVLASTIAGVPPEGEAMARETLRALEAQPMRAIAEERITAAFSDAVDPLMRGHFIEQAALNEKERYLRAARAVFQYAPSSRLDEIAAPALVVVGEADRTVPVAWMEALAGRIRGAQLARIPNAGHLVNLEAPDAFNRTLLQFIG
jgi:pimeloyl-ACP methyl ester carboxylesterase